MKKISRIFLLLYRDKHTCWKTLEQMRGDPHQDTSQWKVRKRVERQTPWNLQEAATQAWQLEDMSQGPQIPRTTLSSTESLSRHRVNQGEGSLKAPQMLEFLFYFPFPLPQDISRHSGTNDGENQTRRSRPQGARRREAKGLQEELQQVRVSALSPCGRTEDCRPGGCTDRKMGE